MPGLIDSIDTIGLLHPITVIETITGKYELAAGRHRLEAHIRLGRKKVPARIVNREYAVMVRSSENYHRASYSVLENSEDMISYRDHRMAWNDDHARAPKGGAQPYDRGNSKTAREFGTTTKRVREAERHVTICEEAKKILRSNLKVQTVVALNDIAGLAAASDQISRTLALVGPPRKKRMPGKLKRPGKPEASASTVSSDRLWLLWSKAPFSKTFHNADTDIQRDFMVRLGNAVKIKTAANVQG
jgi:hypothetical protein